MRPVGVTSSSSEPDRATPETSRDPVTGRIRGGPEPLPKVNRNSRLKTVLRLDPDVGIGVYTESARIQRALESAGLANRIAGNERGAYFLIPADNHELASTIVAAMFNPRGS